MEHLLDLMPPETIWPHWPLLVSTFCVPVCHHSMGGGSEVEGQRDFREARYRRGILHDVSENMWEAETAGPGSHLIQEPEPGNDASVQSAFLICCLFLKALS